MTADELIDVVADLIAASEARVIAAIRAAQAVPADGLPQAHRDLLEALAAIPDSGVLSFSSIEVLDHARVDDRLRTALDACGVTAAAEPAAKLGAVLRGLRDQEIAGLRLLRDGREWRLVRTSCT